MANYTIMGNRLKIKVKISLTQFANQKPYFSVTADVYEHTGRRGRPRFLACGCCHEYIQQITDKFNDVISLHLCHMDGTPMYAVENGKYRLGLTKYQSFDVKRVMSHFRCNEDEAYTLLKHANTGNLEEYIDNIYRPRWKQKADAIIHKYNLQIEREE